MVLRVYLAALDHLVNHDHDSQKLTQKESQKAALHFLLAQETVRSQPLELMSQGLLLQART